MALFLPAESKDQWRLLHNAGVLYPRIILPDGWREVVPTNETHWADEDLNYGEFFGVPVGDLIECC